MQFQEGGEPPIAHVAGWPLLLRVAGACAALLLVSCVYDENDRCGDSRVFENGLCFCPDGKTDVAGKCVAKPEQDASVAEDAGGLGTACDEDTPCADPTHPNCHTTATDGYCTNTGCKADADCEDGYYCGKDTSPTYCKRFPTGYNKPCSSDTDCKGLDADYCSKNPAGRTCVVKDCSDDSCAPGTACVDISKFLPGEPKICAEPF